MQQGGLSRFNQFKHDYTQLIKGELGEGITDQQKNYSFCKLFIAMSNDVLKPNNNGKLPNDAPVICQECGCIYSNKTMFKNYHHNQNATIQTLKKARKDNDGLDTVDKVMNYFNTNAQNCTLTGLVVISSLLDEKCPDYRKRLKVAGVPFNQTADPDETDDSSDTKKRLAAGRRIVDPKRTQLCVSLRNALIEHRKYIGDIHMASDSWMRIFHRAVPSNKSKDQGKIKSSKISVHSSSVYRVKLLIQHMQKQIEAGKEGYDKEEVSDEEYGSGEDEASGENEASGEDEASGEEEEDVSGEEEGRDEEKEDGETEEESQSDENEQNEGQPKKEPVDNILDKLEKNSYYQGKELSGTEKKMIKMVKKRRPAKKNTKYLENLQWFNTRYPLYTASPDMVLVDKKTKKPLKLIELKCTSEDLILKTEYYMQYQLMMFLLEVQSMMVGHMPNKKSRSLKFKKVRANDKIRELFLKQIPFGFKRFYLPYLVTGDLTCLTPEEADGLEI